MTGRGEPSRPSKGKTQVREISQPKGALVVATLVATLLMWPSPARAEAVPQAAATTGATCEGDQLAIGGFGSSTAAGTVVFTVRMSDVSSARCTLEGYPTVSFVGPHGESLRVSLHHSGPGPAFGHPQQVALTPARATAALVITYPDDMQPGQHCARVARLHVGLPNGGGALLSPPVPPPFELCSLPASPADAPFPANSSALVPDSVAAGYAPAWPECQASELKMVLGGEGAATGPVYYTLTLVPRLWPGPLCTLDGYPGLELVGPTGSVVLRFVPGRSAGTFPPVPRPRPVSVGYQDRAQVIFEAGDYRPTANGGRGAACPSSTELVLTLPGGGQLVARRQFHLCEQGGVGAFTAALSDLATEPTSGS